MGKCGRKKGKAESTTSQEVSSTEWKHINMTEEEEDLICRMHWLLGDRWELIAGRIPGRKSEEIERFWIMRHTRSHIGGRRGRKRCRVVLDIEA